MCVYIKRNKKKGERERETKEIGRATEREREKRRMFGREIYKDGEVAR